MPMSKDKNGGGTTSTGEHTTEYCSHCYLNGTFVLSHISAAEMVELVKKRFKEMGIPTFLSSMLTREIPTLKRWASQVESVGEEVVQQVKKRVKKATKDL